MTRVLIVDDEANVVRTLARILERRGLEVRRAEDGGAALRVLDSEAIDLIITDLKMPGMDGSELLAEIHDRGLGIPSIVLTGYGTVQSAVEAMHLGASDYLIKPCNPDELLLVVERQLESRNLRRENQRLRDEARRHQRFGEIVGQSRPMLDLYRLLDALSQNKSNVLITGESGTGKELVARTIHQRGQLASEPFLAVNCAGMSDTLIDSQLFGHKRGAFTGATDDHEGMFLAASGGTLFLDEVFEIPLSLQPKFLRALQEREVMPLGSNQTSPIDVRIIAATHRDLEAESRKGNFRADLYYRLNVVSVRLPPLRERRDDIPILVENFCREFGRIYRIAPKEVAADAMQALLDHDWPGNVRELQNAIERAFALSRDARIEREHLPPNVFGLAPSRRTGDAVLRFESVPTLAELERHALVAALEESDGNKAQAARTLGIDRQRLYRKLRKYGVSD